MMAIDLDVPKPHEFLELADGQKISFHVLDWIEGPMNITPNDWEGRIQWDLSAGRILQDEAQRRRAQGKMIQGLRVVPPKEDMPPGKLYWDITATTLIAQIKPYLEKPDYKAKKFTVTAHGIAPAKRFTLEVS